MARDDEDSSGVTLFFFLPSWGSWGWTFQFSERQLRTKRALRARARCERPRAHFARSWHQLLVTNNENSFPKTVDLFTCYPRRVPSVHKNCVITAM